MEQPQKSRSSYETLWNRDERFLINDLRLKQLEKMAEVLEQKIVDWFVKNSLIYAAELGDITYKDFLVIVKNHIEERLKHMPYQKDEME